MRQFCGDCQSFQISRSLPGDPPACWCGNPENRRLNRHIGPLRGPDAPSCEFFLPLEMLAGTDNGRAALTITPEELFVEDKKDFVNVAETAHRLGKSIQSVYRLIAEGELQVVRNPGINVYVPSILAFLNRKKRDK